MLLPHVWVVGSWSTFVLTAAAAVLLAANVWAMGGQATERASRRSLLAASPALLAVSSCCGAPAALFLGTAAVASLWAATPWILGATVSMLALSLRSLLRRPDAGQEPGSSRPLLP